MNAYGLLQAARSRYAEAVTLLKHSPDPLNEREALEIVDAFGMEWCGLDSIKFGLIDKVREEEK